jgi:hypothetical protein
LQSAKLPSCPCWVILVSAARRSSGGSTRRTSAAQLNQPVSTAVRSLHFLEPCFSSWTAWTGSQARTLRVHASHKSFMTLSFATPLATSKDDHIASDVLRISSAIHGKMRLIKRQSITSSESGVCGRNLLHVSDGFLHGMIARSRRYP